MKNLNIEEISKFIARQSPETKIYLGADSVRVVIDGKAYADISVAVVVHINGNNGCKVFGEISRQPDYDKRKDKPMLRLINEAIKVSELYSKIQDAIGDRHVEIHIDINKDPKFGSSCAISEAMGYIRSTCFDKDGNPVTLRCKPDAPAASFASDKILIDRQRFMSERE